MAVQLDFVGLITVRGLKLGVGLVTIFVFARIFGVSAMYDAWVWSLGLVNAISLMVFGPFVETFRATYAKFQHGEGQAAADKYIASVSVGVVVGALVIGLGLVALLSLSDDMFGLASTGGLTGDATRFVLLLLPGLVLSQLVAVLTAYMNCVGVVYRPEIAGTLGGAIGTAFIVLFPRLPAVELLLVSYYLGVLAPLAVSFDFLRTVVSRLRQLKWSELRFYVRAATLVALPLFVPYLLGQASGLLERQYAALAGVGGLSVLSYALFARSTLQAVFTSALASLALPQLSHAFQRDGEAAFRGVTDIWVRQCLLVGGAAVVFLYGFSDIAVTILFGKHGLSNSALALAPLLRWYAPALVSVILYLLGGVSLLAAGKGKSYAFAGSLGQVVSMAMVVGFFPRLGLVALPLALCVSHAIAAALMFRAAGRGALRDLGVLALPRLAVMALAAIGLREIDLLLALDAQALTVRIVFSGLVFALLAGIVWFVEHRMFASGTAAAES
ncbi:lipid II flippase MurJ [Sphingomonas sp. NIBR02145]|uniref:lipid II flippase MurJ n=1 Tax=Sphingomonas sp. NIBR02145 TaxID=3014784 RepID=UPI0022B50F4B|nr:lipid II flippase MurJ [Sphingomonas sp. NIBR02145]WHU03008.1 lipid II flippase MurJ [Sphingomonas sp. NIBR02145]